MSDAATLIGLRRRLLATELLLGACAAATLALACWVWTRPVDSQAACHVSGIEVVDADGQVRASIRQDSDEVSLELRTGESAWRVSVGEQVHVRAKSASGATYTLALDDTSVREELTAGAAGERVTVNEVAAERVLWLGDRKLEERLGAARSDASVVFDGVDVLGSLRSAAASVP